MNISYEPTIDELVDAKLRAQKLSKVTRQWKLEGLGWIGLPTFIAVYFIIPDTPIVKSVFASVFSIAFIILYLCSYDGAIRRRIRKLAVEALGSYKP